MSSLNDVVVTYVWDPNMNGGQGGEFQVNATLESIILNPSGYNMAHIGLLLMNKERKARGLSEYKFNPETGTYDESR